MSDPSFAQAKARLGTATRYGRTEEAAQARTDFATANIQKAIRRNVEAAPPLSHEQRQLLASMLWDGE